jgi:hypothetical protein
MYGADAIGMGDQDELPPLGYNASIESSITMYVRIRLCGARPIHVRTLSGRANKLQRFKMVLDRFRLSSLRKALY